MKRRTRRQATGGARGAPAPAASAPGDGAIPPWIPDAMQTALGHFRNGRLAQARDIYIHILEQAPRLDPAVHNLGLVAFEAGDLGLARDLVSHAIRLEGGAADYHMTLGVILDRLGEAGRAGECFARALALDPDSFLVRFNWARALKRQGRQREAAEQLEQALALRPNHVEALSDLGNLYRSMRRLEEARTCFERALDLDARSAMAWANLALVAKAQGKTGEAIDCTRRALELAPGESALHNNLGGWLKDAGHAAEAVESYERAVAASPLDPVPQLGLAQSYAALGKLEDAVASFRRVLELGPASAAAHSAALFSLHYDPALDPAALAAEHRRWAARHTAPLTPARRDWPNARRPERRLRVGYVSADFRRHPVAYFLAPVLAAHDRDSVETICYSGAIRADEWTERLRASAALWREVCPLSDAELARRIEEDQVDLLVDLAGHTAGHRLLTFARKPAPVQLSWLGYFNTTGLASIDYLIVDDHLAPPGEPAPFTEQPLRLGRCYLCYRGPEDAPPPGPPPSAASGRVTFGCFNSLSKIGFRVVALWAEILGRLPSARLLLKNAGFDDESARRVYLDEFSRRGVGAERLELAGRSSQAELLDGYSRVDVALDPFPYNGGTTTCEALWMGVPVITLAGDLVVSRVGGSILSAAGLDSLMAGSPADYVERAVALASDAEELARLRAGLRERVASSELGDCAGFTGKLEDAYRSVWRDWCASGDLG